MSEQNVIEAIHRLELKMTEQIGEIKSELHITNERLRNMDERVEDHDQSLYGCDQKGFPGVINDVGTLKKSDNERKWTVRTVFTGFIAMFVKVIWDAFSI